MPAFSAINVEPEESYDDEVNVAKQIQVDEAFKLFQTALKLHAQGPRFFDEAADAYHALFESEIFKLPEAKTEYERTELERTEREWTERERTERQPEGLAVIEQSFAQEPDVAGDVDGIGNSLLQALYLSHKNHGQFVLDRIRYKAHTSKNGANAVFEEREVLQDARRALDDFTASLDRDPSDAELWRRTARLAGFLKSARISRYSLEAAIELDDDPAVVEVEPPSLAEAFAGEQLKNQLKILDDGMALSHPIMKAFSEREVPVVLKRHLDPIPFLPNPIEDLAVSKPPTTEVMGRPRTVIDVPIVSWSELGLALVRFVLDSGLSGEAIHLQLPEVSIVDEVQMEIDRQLQPEAEVVAAKMQPEAPSVADVATEKTQDAELRMKESQPGSIENQSVMDDAIKEQQSASLPSRKRSQSAAGLPEPLEDETVDTKRSKRTRRRDTTVEEVMDPATLLATQLQPFQAADQNLFQTTKNILENLGVIDQVTLDRLAEMLDTCASDDRTGKITNPATVDLRDAILHFSENDAKVFLNKKETPQFGLSAFLEHAKSGSQRSPETPPFDETRSVKQFVARVNSGWYSIHDIGYDYVKALTKSYLSQKWPEPMKRAAVQVINRLDEIIYDRTAYELERHRAGQSSDDAFSETHELVQMLFELHLDVYERITNPESAVDLAVRSETRAKLGRWLELAATVSNFSSRASDERMSARFLWAAVFSTRFGGTDPDHILGCWNSLRDYLSRVDDGLDISLPNNAVIPEISLAAADREISKLTTMDFFLGVFQENDPDPVTTIETLEPVLNPDSVFVSSSADDNDVDGDSGGGGGGGGGKNGKPRAGKQPIVECASQGLRDLWKFLGESSTELRLFLWTRLADAYGKIKYATKQFSCYLKSIEMIIADFERDSYINAPPDSRKMLFISMLKSVDDLLIPALYLALNDNSSFDIIDDDHLRCTASTLAKLSCLLHVAAMFEDEVRIGMTQAPATGSTYISFLNKIREMQVRTWSLQYTVLKVGIYQHKAIFPRPENDLADYLAAVHQVLGLRKCCKVSNRIFLKMMRVELLKQKNIENWEDYLGQVLYDLHGLKLGVGIWEVQDHGCPAERLERRQAMSLVEKIMILANRMSMKDLLKSDLKTTIEHMQQAIGSPKSTPQMIHNLRNFTEYLKKPIHPLRLYQALSGNVTLDAIDVNTPESALARQGWFFLLGMIAFTRFKGVDLNRRQTPGATDDLRLGATYLRLQLQFTPDRWDAWFRLAECFDYELDEAVLWTADKMNKDRAELVRFQRNSIHCYTLALSHSHARVPGSTSAIPSSSSSSSPASEDEEALYSLYHNFAMRLYASSREPFGMEPFRHSDQERFFIETTRVGTYRKIVHEEMTDYKVWKFAANLFKRAMAGKPRDWKNPYMLSKCLWKMYKKPADELDVFDRAARPTLATLIQSLEKAIQVVSALPKPRHGQDPILEPHYKMLSIVHKLVTRGDLPAQEGVDILARQPYAPQRNEKVVIVDNDEWEGYVIRCLRYLRDKDKSNWQHRLIMRHARILFDADDTEGDDGGGYVSAKAAFAVLRENMLTKTMVMNVWKCDAERPGRHHVYTERYIRFIVRLLYVMNDRTNMEAVLRRIRKKGADFYHFNELWQSCVLTYLRLLRQSYHISLPEEDVFKGLTPEEFDIVGDRIADWVTTPEAENNLALAAMKETVELKKLNANLLKVSPVDDLIVDCYTALYVEIGPSLPGPAPSAVIEERHRVKEGPADIDGTVDSKAGLVTGGSNKQQQQGHADRDRLAAALGSLRATSEQAEKMEKQPSSTGGGADGAASRARRIGVRRPDILRKAEQAVSRAAEGPTKSAASASSSKSRIGSTSSGRNGSAAPNNRDAGSGSGSSSNTEGEDDGNADASAEKHQADEHEDEEDDEGGSDNETDNDDVEMKNVGAAGLEDKTEGHHDEGDEEEDEAGTAGSEAPSPSPPRSVHDSADDESDLSDVPPDYEDDIPPSLLFPNLRRSVGVATGAGQTATERGESTSGSTVSETSSPASDEEEEEEEGEGEGDEGEDEEEDEDRKGDDSEVEEAETDDGMAVESE